MTRNFPYIFKFSRSGSYGSWLLIPVLLLFLAKDFAGDICNRVIDVSIELVESADHKSGDKNEESKKLFDNDEYLNQYNLIDHRMSSVISPAHLRSGKIRIEYSDNQTPPPEQL